VKLLFDQNLAPALVTRLADLFPGSEHVDHLGLGMATDRTVWDYARDKGLTLVTKDADFGEFVMLHGFPPKVLWLRIGNCTTDQVEALLRLHHDTIEEFGVDPSAGILSLT
jgi:predicted nuclease of predicted toxin-antitoxin system